jgi:hypothetical protein
VESEMYLFSKNILRTNSVNIISIVMEIISLIEEIPKDLKLFRMIQTVVIFRSEDSVQGILMLSILESMKW